MRNRVFIIAEIGVNHNGDIKLAYKMIDKAIEAGVDAVKFQTFISNNLVSKFAEKAKYQEENCAEDGSQLEMIKKLELSFKEFKELKEYCDKREIMFLSTPFDFESIEFLKSLNMDIYKIPSGEINNIPYLRKISKISDRVILSTGMSTMDEIEVAVNIFKKDGVKDITILHCNTEYPTPFQDVNLNVLETLRKKFKLEVGYSDHTLGIEVPIAAVALGAKVIEKHFTLDKNMKGPDHRASLDPVELRDMVNAIRNIEKSLGSSIKEPTQSEMKNINVARKSIVAKRNISIGDIFSEDNLTVKRPGYGIPPSEWENVLGKVATKNYKEDEMILNE